MKYMYSYATHEPKTSSELSERRITATKEQASRNRRLGGKVAAIALTTVLAASGAPKVVETTGDSIHSAETSVGHFADNLLNAQQRIDEGLRRSNQEIKTAHDQQEYRQISAEQTQANTQQ